MADGMWEGWLEFDPVEGGPTIPSQRETTQPNRIDTEYWATGLTPIFLEGCLRRALDGPLRVRTVPVRPPAYQTPAPPQTAILDPFSVYRKGEDMLRRQLAALSARHLVSIILDYELSEAPVEILNVTPPSALIDMIVERVREESVLRE